MSDAVLCRVHCLLLFLNDCMVLLSQTVYRLWCNTDDHHKQMLIASSEQIHCTVCCKQT